MPHGSISLPVTFGTPKNYRTESILSNIAEVNLPFNAILGRSTYTSSWLLPTTGTWS
jgi:hypothetical protein